MPTSTLNNTSHQPPLKRRRTEDDSAMDASAAAVWGGGGCPHCAHCAALRSQASSSLPSSSQPSPSQAAIPQPASQSSTSEPSPSTSQLTQPSQRPSEPTHSHPTPSQPTGTSPPDRPTPPPSYTLTPPPTRSPDVWFDDGSVVLQAQNVQFRVHRTMLSRHSEVFRDMFEIGRLGSSINASNTPQAADPTPLVDGCPLIILHDDPTDLTHLLLSLYDKPHTTTDALPFATLAALLRLGRKYHFPSLYAEALRRLQSEFPASLEEWEKLPQTYTYIVEEEGLLFDIVNLALEMEVHEVLPSAYYLCVQDLNDLLYGIPRPNSPNGPAMLPPHIKNLCIQARERLLALQYDMTFAWIDLLGNWNQEDHGVNTDCLKPDHCGRIAGQLVREVFLPLPEVNRTLEKWTDFTTYTPLVNQLCAVCLEDARVCHEAGRRKVWEGLSGVFGLG
ncbi:hypothetical protein CC1G_03060 [Coprinopsis cinerea okayama7|uniref:BTB domain-containing protein n=1 Tax=Coprinopsis cinerea (strain Okayama-7 / 130 / ATCC MYA-4618 / FGSC 9003) TaxID=240176 RepID=A8PES0_COPC7|nr:hypothetical protein CC1G_03060 [Coprinopsis cinerea okayama7\|eukprot:XP_001840831.1 hypothetical protein CC1G_03060 [Coprinopsis cinerea okayama7\